MTVTSTAKRLLFALELGGRERGVVADAGFLVQAHADGRFRVSHRRSLPHRLGDD